MRSVSRGCADPAEWDVARPEWPSQVVGVTMAGFAIRTVGTIRIVPHPAVMLFLSFGDGVPVLADTAGERQVSSVVTGPGFGDGGTAHASVESADVVQVRLSPTVTRAVLGVSPIDLDGALVTFDDLWAGTCHGSGSSCPGPQPGRSASR